MTHGTFETDDINEFKEFVKLMQKEGYIIQDEVHSVTKKKYSTTFKKK